MSVPPDRFNEARQARDSTNRAGNPVYEWNLTDPSLTDLVRLVMPPDKVLPVIFVPGIMGSNLMDLQGNPVWRLNTTAGQPLWLANKMLWNGAGTRQRLMHPARVRVNPGGNVPDKPVGSVTDAAQYRDQRFWGEVAEGSYHSFLLWLEERLNGQGYNPARWSDFYFVGISTAPRPGERPPEPRLHPGTSMSMRDFDFRAPAEKQAEPLMSDDLLQRAKFRMPVYACGYNWLASNMQAAEELRNRIGHVMDQVKKAGFKCEQVVLVTHSMGGLVSRRCAQLPGMQDKIAGIVHGVMPAVGAAVAYRRCKVGMYDEDLIASQVIGRNGREVTAVFAQAPGALQLLPTQEYRPHWLMVKDSANKDIVEPQPINDPYADIYLRQDRWWGLIRQEWLRPEGGVPQTWADFVKNIEKTREFHDQIRGHYHPCSYVYYGADQEQPSFETVEWRITAPHGPYHVPAASRPTPEQVGSMGFGNVRGTSSVLDTGDNPLHVVELPNLVQTQGPYAAYPPQARIHWQLRCAPQDGGGDGTVPISSGRSPLSTATNKGNIRQQFRLTGFNHEASFKNTGAQFATLYALQKVAGQAKVPA